MKILKIFLILSSLFLVLNADEKSKHFYKNLDYLDLEENQIKGIKSALVELKKEYENFYEYKDKQEDILKDIIKAEKFDENLYYKTLLKIKEEAAKQETKRIKKIHEILDEKQRKKFANYLEEWEVE